MKPLKKWLGERIVKARKEAGFSDQGEFAHALGTQQPTVSRWESGKFEPGPEFLKKIADVTKKPLSFFQPDIEPPSPIPPDQLAVIQKYVSDAKRFSEEERAQIVDLVMGQLKETLVTHSIQNRTDEAFKFKNNPRLKALYDIASHMSDTQLQILIDFARTIRDHKGPPDSPPAEARPPQKKKVR